jgi:hypothetical protein
MHLETLSLGERIRLAARLAALEHVRAEIERLHKSSESNEASASQLVPTVGLRRVVARPAERPAA